MEKHQIKKEFAVIIEDTHGYQVEELDTIEECIDFASQNTYGKEWFIVKRVNFEVKQVIEKEHNRN